MKLSHDCYRSGLTTACICQQEAYCASQTVRSRCPAASGCSSFTRSSFRLLDSDGTTLSTETLREVSERSQRHLNCPRSAAADCRSGEGKPCQRVNLSLTSHHCWYGFAWPLCWFLMWWIGEGLWSISCLHWPNFLLFWVCRASAPSYDQLAALNQTWYHQILSQNCWLHYAYLRCAYWSCPKRDYACHALNFYSAFRTAILELSQIAPSLLYFCPPFECSRSPCVALRLNRKRHGPCFSAQLASYYSTYWARWHGVRYPDLPH